MATTKEGAAAEAATQAARVAGAAAAATQGAMAAGAAGAAVHTRAARPGPGGWFGGGAGPAKAPRKVNVFESMVSHQGMLEQLPLFPYFGPGDIVPTAALSFSTPDMPRVHFYHYNDVPEVILTMAGDGAALATGQLYLQQGTHGVTTFLRQPRAPEARSYQVSLVIFRMKREGPHNEAFALRCPACNAEVFRLERDVSRGPARPHYPELANLRFYADAADAFNAEPRACAGCGAALDRFPVEMMGWRRYAQYAELANRARDQLDAAAGGPASARAGAAGGATGAATGGATGAKGS
ncbi:MAG TPA: hypothetical protein VFS00_04465 [Polyangiaceae bacterium]|nr:hypothetical protein [Polyangiaceae bacterium]